MEIHANGGVLTPLIPPLGTPLLGDDIIVQSGTNGRWSSSVERHVARADISDVGGCYYTGTFHGPRQAQLHGDWTRTRWEQTGIDGRTRGRTDVIINEILMTVRRCPCSDDQPHGVVYVTSAPSMCPSLNTTWHVLTPYSKHHSTPLLNSCLVAYI